MTAFVFWPPGLPNTFAFGSIVLFSGLIPVYGGTIRSEWQIAYERTILITVIVRQSNSSSCNYSENDKQ